MRKTSPMERAAVRAGPHKHHAEAKNKSQKNVKVLLVDATLSLCGSGERSALTGLMSGLG